MTAARPTIQLAARGSTLRSIPKRRSPFRDRHCSNPRAVRQPLSAHDACGIVNAWLDRLNVAVVGAGDRFWEIFQAQVADAQVSGPLVTDAALAALAFEHGAILCSIDSDFRRFRGLKLLDTLEKERPR